MSRILGHKARHARMRQLGAMADNSPEGEGRAMFQRGEACPPASQDRGKAYAKWRGWMRAAAQARTAMKKGAS